MIKKRYRVNLPEQQAECEANYGRLQRVLRDVASLAMNDTRQYLLGCSLENESKICFSVVEQTKYTTLVHIAQFSSLKNTKPYAKTEDALAHGDSVHQLDVRLYHDVLLAEVVACQHHSGFIPRYEYPNDEMHQVDEKVQINRFLGELLSHCLLNARVDTDIVGNSLVDQKYV